MLKGGFVLQLVPALIGAFVGPLVLAYELETGTFRYAWTQAFGRSRWTLAKLVMLGVAVTAMAGAFRVLVSWYYQPYLAPGRLYSAASPLRHWLFDLRGVAFAGWTLTAFAMGALAGIGSASHCRRPGEPATAHMYQGRTKGLLPGKSAVNGI
jgi:hypothetical protein